MNDIQDKKSFSCHKPCYCELPHAKALGLPDSQSRVLLSAGLKSRSPCDTQFTPLWFYRIRGLKCSKIFDFWHTQIFDLRLYPKVSTFLLKSLSTVFSTSRGTYPRIFYFRGLNSFLSIIPKLKSSKIFDFWDMQIFDLQLHRGFHFL